MVNGFVCSVSEAEAEMIDEGKSGRFECSSWRVLMSSLMLIVPVDWAQL